jgi:hypothetical protein
LFSDEISGWIKCDERKRKIYIKKASEDLDFEISVGKDWLPEKVIQKDQTGAIYIYIFKDYRKKVKVNKKDFLLKFSENVDIINMQ